MSSTSNFTVVPASAGSSTDSTPSTGTPPAGTPPAGATPAPIPPELLEKLQNEGALRQRETRLTSLENELAELRNFKSQFVENPVQFATDHGVQPEDWLRSVSTPADPAAAAQDTAQREVQALKTELATIKEQMETQQTRVSARAKEQEIRASIDDFVSKNPQYGVIGAAQLKEVVFNRIAQHAVNALQQYGKPEILDVQVAADWALAEVVPQMRAAVESLKQHQQFADLFGGPPQPGGNVPGTNTHTLTSGLGVSAPAGSAGQGYQQGPGEVPVDTSRMSEAELRDYALRKLKWTTDE